MAVQFRAALIAAVAFVRAARVVQLTIVEDTRRLLRESFAVFVLGLIGGTWWALQMVGDCSMLVEMLQEVVKTVKFIEGRLERFVQTGNETTRHLMQIVEDYQPKKDGGEMRYPLRLMLEEQAYWVDGRRRCGLPARWSDWNIIVQTCHKMLEVQIGEYDWYTRHGKTDKEKQENYEKRESLQWNLEHLKQLKVFKGEDTVEDPMEQMVGLENEWLQGPEGGRSYADCKGIWSNSVAYSSALLQVKDFFLWE